MPRVLVTRAPHQASALAEQLRAHGVEPILIPTIELTDPTSFVSLDDALSRLESFHWLLFTSANAVEVFAQRLRLLDPGTAVLSGASKRSSCRVAAIGAATNRVLEAAGLRVDLLPRQAVAESLAEALLPHALQPGGGPTRFLLIRAETARDVLPDSLRAAGAEVIVGSAYRTVIPSGSVSAIQGLFSKPSTYPDAVTFTSSSTAINLLALLEAAKLTLPTEILRISIGPVTSRTLRELGLPAHAEANEPTVLSLVEMVVKFLGRQGAD